MPSARRLRRGARAYHRARSRGAATPACTGIDIPCVPVDRGCGIPYAQWPGMWQPTTRRRRPRRRDGTVQTHVHALARAHDDARARRPRAARSRAASARAGADGRGLGRLPGVLDRRVADDRLVGLEATVDDVEQDRLAGHEVERGGQERVVLRDQVDLARRRRACRARSAASPARAPPRSRDGERRRPRAGATARCGEAVRTAGPVHRGSLWRGDRNDPDRRLTPSQAARIVRAPSPRPAGGRIA